MDLSILSAYEDCVLREAPLPGLPNPYHGKVRDNYDLPDGRRLIVATDRLSAFDIILTAIPLKGQVLTQLARHWFDATADICPNHVIGYPDPNVLLCKRLTIFPIEIVVRSYLAGTTGTSIWPMYRDGQRVIYGHHFPDGMTENQKLPAPIITPTTKAMDGAHDAPLTIDEVTERGLLTPEQWEKAQKIAFSLFDRGVKRAAERGLILVDTKYEFGFDEAGNIIVADEIHTPDSSRYWMADSYAARVTAGQKPESFDKDFVRSWVVARCDPYKEAVPEIPPDVVLAAAQRYIETYEILTGKSFALPSLDQPILERIRSNLAAFGAV